MDSQNKGKLFFVAVERLNFVLCSLLCCLCTLNGYRLSNTEDLQTLKIKL